MDHNKSARKKWQIQSKGALHQKVDLSAVLANQPRELAITTNLGQLSNQ
jgi:hypothetical protein